MNLPCRLLRAAREGLKAVPGVKTKYGGAAFRPSAAQFGTEHCCCLSACVSVLCGVNRFNSFTDIVAVLACVCGCLAAWFATLIH